MSTVPLRAGADAPSNGVLPLVLANAVTIAMALAFSWPAATLLFPYWIQSVIIGYFAQKRIRALHEFSTDNFEINDHPVAPTEETKRQTANFFVLHYGCFHLGYLFFLGGNFRDLRWLDLIGIATASISFAVNHRASFARNVAADIKGKPNIGTLMFLPYARIVPMHLTIILGGAAHFAGPFPILLFGALKTAADVLMHKVEHRILQKNAPIETN